MTNNREAFDVEYPGIVAFLEGNTWSNFCVELLAQVDSKGWLSDRQLDAVERMQAKLQARAIERQAADAARERNKATVDLSKIWTMFDKATAAGLKKLCYRAEGLALTPAGANSKNAGGIYAKRIVDGVYVGKIMGTQFLPVRECLPEDVRALTTLARDPAAAATAYGRATGTCSCCGRELTNPESIALGIGPICASKWGFL
jgi:hypothetical protein